jgi:hypothetical protein
VAFEEGREAKASGVTVAVVGDYRCRRANHAQDPGTMPVSRAYMAMTSLNLPEKMA